MSVSIGLSLVTCVCRSDTVCSSTAPSTTPNVAGSYGSSQRPQNPPTANQRHPRTVCRPHLLGKVVPWEMAAREERMQGVHRVRVPWDKAWRWVAVCRPWHTPPCRLEIAGSTHLGGDASSLRQSGSATWCSSSPAAVWTSWKASWRSDRARTASPGGQKQCVVITVHGRMKGKGGSRCNSITLKRLMRASTTFYFLSNHMHQYLLFLITVCTLQWYALIIF